MLNDYYLFPFVLHSCLVNGFNKRHNYKSQWLHRFKVASFQSMSWSTVSLKKTSVWPRLLPGSLHWTDTSWRQRQWCTAQSLPASTLCQRLCLFHCLHLTGKPWAVPVLRNLRKITVTLKKKNRCTNIYIWDNCICKLKQGEGRWSSLKQSQRFVCSSWGFQVLL